MNDSSNFIGSAADGDPALQEIAGYGSQLPHLEALWPNSAEQRDRFVRVTAKCLRDMRPGLKLTNEAWSEVLGQALSQYFFEPNSNRLVVLQQLD